MKLTESQISKIQNFIKSHNGCDVREIEDGLGVPLLDIATQEELENQCLVGAYFKKDARYYSKQVSDNEE